MLPFFVSIPHSGEKVPPTATWLQGLPEKVLMCDVDRFVDRLYEPSLNDLKIPFVKTEWHRYSGDLNRFPEDVDASSVIGNKNPVGKFARGFLWTITTTELPLMKSPTTPEIHKGLVELVYEPFHRSIRDYYEKFRKEGAKHVYHLDAHSMPSVGTKQHKDPGEQRAEIVVSDCQGKSCSKAYCDLVIASYTAAGFKVAYNWPYVGGRVTEQYGNPSKGQEALQVEMNRDLYMDEVEKQYILAKASVVQAKVKKALTMIQEGVAHLPL